jgi:endonuclease G
MRKTAQAVKAVLCLGLVFSFAGCAVQSVHTRPAIGSAHVALQAGLTAEQKADVAANCYEGMPLKTSEELGPTEIVFRKGYVLEESSTDKIPLWVCEGVDESQLTGNLSRSDKFQTDPALKGPHSTPSDYSRSGYDRGHQAPAGNQTTNATLKDETFYMSNMAPQLPTLNRDAWKSLEEKTRDWVKQYGHAYEWTGPIFYDPKEDSADTANGTVDYKTIGKDSVAVPTHFYKIVVVKDGSQYKSIAFVMPNQKYKPPYHLEQYIKPVQWIEQHTGLNFMPDLTAAQQTQLEQNAPAMWP